tara:strand:+ start:323 stop:901 length:579 start_codon:yes stop_codon:yes gene_type:complete
MFFDFIIFILLPLLIVYLLYSRWSDDAPLKIFGVPLNKAAIKEFAGVDEDAGFIEGLKQAFSPEIMFGPNSLLTSKNRRKKYYETLIEKEIAFEKDAKCPNCGSSDLRNTTYKTLKDYEYNENKEFDIHPAKSCNVCEVVFTPQYEIYFPINAEDLKEWNELYHRQGGREKLSVIHDYKTIKFFPNVLNEIK